MSNPESVSSKIANFGFITETNNCDRWGADYFLNKPQDLLRFFSFSSGAPPGSSQIIKTRSVEEVLMILD